MPLNKEQKQAVEYLDGPLLVLAGPGTGKTQLLSHRVAYILEHTDASPENILCVTFSDNATANMRDRLASIIGSAAYHVTISTYHAFGADILRQYKNYSATFTRPLDAPIDEVTAYKIIRDLQASLDPLDPLRSGKTTVKEISEIIGAAKKARLTPDDLITIHEKNVADGAAFTPPISDLILKLRAEKIKDYDAAVETIYRPILEILAQWTSPEPIASKILPLANQLTLDLNQAIQDGVGYSPKTGKNSVTPLTNWYKRYFEVAPDGSYRLKDYVANLKLASIAKIYRAYEAYLEQNALYDFNDMIEEAVAALKTDRGFRLSLSEKYQYILLDEFQDTNPSQFEIIRLLTDYEKPNIMAVGDDDQTIFEFQGARPDNLIDFQKDYDAKLINLSKNYRSTTEIVNLGRAVATQIPDSFEKIMNVPKTLTAENNHLFSNGKIERYEFASSDSEYSWISNKIKELLENNIKAKDICIITPQHKYIQPLLPYLKQDNIPITYEKSENLLDDPQIKELTTLSEFIYALANEEQPAHRLLEILSFPFWDLPAETVMKHIRRDSSKTTLAYLLDAPDKDLQRTGKILAELVKLSVEAPLEQFLDYLIGTLPLSPDNNNDNDDKNLKSPFLSYYETKSDYFAFTLYDHLQTLRSKITSHVKTERPTLKDFIAFLADYRDAGATIISTSPYEDNANSVHILTVHKSKGLEYDYVFLIAVDDENWGNAGGNKSRLSLPKNLSPLKQDGTSESELLRKFFVAVTRAKSHLIMTNSIRNYAGKTPPRLEYLAESEDPDRPGVIRSPKIPSGEVITMYESAPEAKLRTDLKAGWLAHYFNPTPDFMQVLLAQQKSYRLSSTDLTTFLDINHAGPAEFYKSRILGAPRDPGSPSLRLGTVVHAAFERVTKEGIADAEAIDFAKTEIEKLQITSAEKSELESLAVASLEKSLAKFKDILRADQSRSRAELSLKPTFENIPLTGVIDHLNINQKEKTIEVYDFKTGGHHEGKWHTKDPILFKYRLQLCFYKLLLELTPEYQNYKITTGHILFVKPDASGEVYDEPYAYNDKDQEELKTLIKIVYNHITTLDYLSDPTLSLEPNPTLPAKDFFAFISRVIEGA